MLAPETYHDPSLRRQRSDGLELVQWSKEKQTQNETLFTPIMDGPFRNTPSLLPHMYRLRESYMNRIFMNQELLTLGHYY